MKKTVFFIFSILLLVSANIIITHESNSSGNQIEFIAQNTAFANISEEWEFKCYTRMVYSHRGRVLECNTPCCYKTNYVEDDAALEPDGKCKGKFLNC